MKELLKYKIYTTSIIPSIFIVSILFARFYGGHLLFHSFAEIFSILVGLMMIVIVSYTYQFTKNNFLLYLGIGYFWIAILDLFHMLTFPGMSIYIIKSSNITLTFWLAARFLEAFVLFSAVFVNFYAISKSKVFILFGLITFTVYTLAFSKYVPILYEQGSGLTSLKINIEYTIIFTLIITIIFYIKRKEDFDKSIYYYVIASIILTICTEFTLTFYAKVDDSFTMLAHLFKFLSYWMIFLSMIKTSLEKPFKFLAHESSTYNSIPFPSILVDDQGIIRQINDSTTTFLNLEKNKIINQNNHMLFHNQSIKEEECKVCQAIKNGDTLLSYSLQKEALTYSCTVSPIHMKKTALGSVQVCIDISKQLQLEQDRVQAQKSLEQKQSELFQIIQASPIAIFVLNKEHIITHWNIACEKMTGKLAKDMIGTSKQQSSFYGKEKLTMADLAIKQSIDTEIDIYYKGKYKKSPILENVYEVEEFLSKFGEDGKWISFSATTLKNEDGEVIGAIEILQDISERKRNELIRSNNESRFRRLFENSEVSIWNEDITEVIKSLEELRKAGVIDLHKHLTQNIKLAEELAMKIKVIDVNSATLKLFNADSKEQFLAGINKTFGDNAIEVFIDELDAIWKKETSFSKEVFFKKFDGEIIHGIITLQIPKQLEEFSNLSVSIIDITNLKKAEKKLQLSNIALIKGEEKLHTLLDSLSVGVIVHAPDTSIIMNNPKASELLGLKNKQLIGMLATDPKWQFLDASQNTIPLEEYPVNKVINSKKDVTNMLIGMIHQNTTDIVWVLANGFPIFNNQNEITEIIINFIDITELKNKDEMLINQSRHAAMGEMIGMIAHQWRQPISTISMDANNMLLDIAIDNFSISASEDYANSIAKQTQHLSKTIDDFRNFFKPDKVISKVNIRDVLNQTLSIVKDSLKNNNIELKTSFETDKEVEAYPRELMQVFVNIITNSKDVLVHNKIKNSQIKIKVYEDEKYINTEICDNGGGIDSSILSKIFDPYFSTKDEKTGTGLGLYMSKMIIEVHLNGIIDANNDDDGACFTVRLIK